MKFEKRLKCFLAGILISIVYACNQSEDATKYVGTALDTSKIDTTKYNSEYIHYSTVKINGVLPLYSKYADFIKVIGKPDSVYNMGPNDDCAMFMEPYQEAYSKGNMFYILKDTAAFQKIDFRERPDLELRTPAITLNGNTTLQEMDRLFPKAVKNMSPILYNGISLMMVSLSPSKEYVDENWIFFFDGEKLVIAEMAADC